MTRSGARGAVVRVAVGGLVLAAAPPSSGGDPPSGGLPDARIEFPNGAQLVVDGLLQGAHGRFRVLPGALEYICGGWTLRYDTDAVEPSPAPPDASLESRLAERLGEAESHAPEVGPVAPWATRMGAHQVWLAQTLGGRPTGRPPALALAADLPGQRLLLVQATFPWQESWRANTDLVALLRRARFVAGRSLSPPSVPAVVPGPPGPAPARVASPFEPWPAPPPLPESRVVPFAAAGFLLSFQALPIASWRLQPGGAVRIEGPHRLSVRFVALPTGPADGVASAALRSAEPTADTPMVRPLGGMPPGGEGTPWVAEVWNASGEEGRWRAIVAVPTPSRTLGIDIGPAPWAQWTRWRAEVEAVVGSLAIGGTDGR